jgi:FlaA1/EpsC-like NDP-sugar epimerase
MRNRYILLADLPLVATAAFGAFALRFDWLFAGHHPEFPPFLVAAVLIKPAVFLLFGMYGRYWRYASVQDVLAVTLAVSAASIAMALFVAIGRVLDLTPNFSRQVLLIDWLMTLALIGGLRMSVRIVGDARQLALKGTAGPAPKRVLVVGAGEAGTLVVREMLKNPQLGLQPAGFLDDAEGKQGKSINGIRVLGPLGSLPDVLRSGGIGEVVIAMPSASGSAVRSIAEQCRLAGVGSRAVPGVYELLDGQVSVSRLRNVEIADLLRRRPVPTPAGAADYLRGRSVLVTGAGGSIGAELCRQVAFARPHLLVLLGHGENSIFDVQHQIARQYPDVAVAAVIADVRDDRRMRSVFTSYRPDVVLHAAAHKHVPLMEDNPEEAITNNVLGTRCVVATAEAFGTDRLVMISTDKAVAPRCIMGASKRLAEAVVRDAARRSGRAFAVVRFGNVLGSRGSVVPFFKAQIERGGPVTVTHPDMKRFFMTIPEAVHLVLQAGGLGRGGELFVLDMGEPVRIADLAADLIRLSGLDVGDIGIEFTGIRQGEKLEEALWERNATVDRTAHEDVFRVTEDGEANEEEWLRLVPMLTDAASQGDRATVDRLLVRCFPAAVRSEVSAAQA